MTSTSESALFNSSPDLLKVTNLKPYTFSKDLKLSELSMRYESRCTRKGEGVVKGFHIWGFAKLEGTFLGSP